MKKIIFTTLMCIGSIVFFAGLAFAYPMTAALNAMQVVPATNSPARGVCKVDYREDYDINPYMTVGVYDITCEFSGLSGGLIDADVRWASAGQNGDGFCEEKQVWVTLPNNGSGSLRVSCLRGLAWMEGFHPRWTYVVLQTASFPAGEVRGQIKPLTLDKDVDGEGRAEISIFRPADRTAWSYCGMTGGPILKQLNWQPATDSTPFLADFDGDGIADWAFIHNDNVNLISWIWVRSRDNQINRTPFGMTSLGDIPAYGDFDGDGVADIAVFRTTTGTWWSSAPSVQGVRWGMSDGTPCPADYDGDGKTDLCLMRPENG